MVGGAVGLAAFYAAFFWILGIHLAYWPVWLEGHGLSAGEIGIVLAAMFWARVPAGPLVGALIDRRGDRRKPLMVLAAAVIVGYLLFALAGGFWSLLLVSLLVGATLHSILPITDSLTLLAARVKGLDYGRVRLWGSLSFVMATLVGGWLLADGDIGRVLWIIMAGTVALALFSWFLPDHRTDAKAVRRGSLTGLLRRPVLPVFLLTLGFLQSSHAVLYGFATLHWRQAGIDPTTIGWLWAEGVIAEIILFALAARLARWLTPTRLLMAAAIAGLIRWPILAMTTDLAWLVPAQALHGLTFGAAHLGAMYFFRAAILPAVSATAQSLYGAVSEGLMFGLAMILAGSLYGALGGQAFLAMTLFSVLGGAGVIALAILWDGGPLGGRGEEGGKVA